MGKFFTMFGRLFSKISIAMPAHLKQALSEDGVGSYSRYCGAFSVVVAAIWVTYLMVTTKHMPDLGGPATWITAGQSAYAANQAKKVASAIKGSSTTDTQASSQ
jgi:hypothetical protein